MILANQLKRSVWKGYQLFLIFVNDLKELKSYTVTLDYHPFLHEYVDVFPSEILDMPLQREINFLINLVLGAELI